MVHAERRAQNHHIKARCLLKRNFTTHLMGLSFLQKFEQVWAEKIIKVRTKRNRETFVLSLSSRASPLKDLKHQT